MPEYSIRDKCHVNTNKEADTFVGIKFEDGIFAINFPLGFRLSSDEKSLRKDVLLLLNVLMHNTENKESKALQYTRNWDADGFPLQAYLYMIADYYKRGYYKENETEHIISEKGKIDWGKTIKRIRPYVQDDEVYYLKFVTSRNMQNENELITMFHEYCVYESFCKLGWLFTATLPKKPRVRFNKKLFVQVLRGKLEKTFNDSDKELFSNMLAIVQCKQDSDFNTDFRYGTMNFEYVWEAMIDTVFGIEGKEFYFPKTSWHLSDGFHDNANLEPDSIMLWNGDVYVLDAKYYKYGVTRRPTDLPESTSINKQITYGEYIATHDKFKEIHGDNYTVYNAFLLPYASSEGMPEMLSIGEAISDWKSNNQQYERIQGILIDCKHLMRASAHTDIKEMNRLAECILESIT